MNTKKLVKWGVALASALVLGGAIVPVGGNLVNTSTVYAEEQSITYRIHYFLNDVVENGGTPSYTDIAPYKEGVIAKGETIVEVAPNIDGYAVAGNNTISVTYDHVAGDNVWHDEDWYPTSYFFYDKVETLKPTDPVTPPTDGGAGGDTATPPTDTQTDPVTPPSDGGKETPVKEAAGKVSTEKVAETKPAVETQSATATTPAAKTLPNTGEASSIFSLVGTGLIGLVGLIKRKND